MVLIFHPKDRGGEEESLAELSYWQDIPKKPQGELV